MAVSSAKAFFLAGLVMLASAACAPAHRHPLPPVQDAKVIADTERIAQKQFALGAYGKALSAYSTVYDKKHLRGLRSGYLKLGEQIRAASDAAYQRGELLEAGIAYRMLFESGITTRDFAQSLSFDDDYLDSHIEACSNALMEIGLTKYREEKLDEAIEAWKKVLDFDYGNEHAKSAIDTATIQLQRLRAMK
jgi:tetratricopeptide (TPR) repeat protein